MDERFEPPQRPTTRPERSFLWILVTGLLAGVILGGAIFLIRLIQSSAEGSGGGAFLLITIFGVLVLALIAATGFYSFRKRRPALADRPLRSWFLSKVTRRKRWPPPGVRRRAARGPAYLTEQELKDATKQRKPWTMMAWLKSHVYLGVLALVAAFVHALLRPYTTNLSTGKVALIVLVVLVVSGIAWRIVYVRVPKKLGGDPRVRNVAIVDTEGKIQVTEIEIDKLVAGRSPAFRGLVADLVAGRRPPEELEREAATLEGPERLAWDRAKVHAADRFRYVDRLGRQRRYHRILQGWRLAHLPLAAILGAIVVVHILDVLGVGRAVFGGDRAEFASSAQCADCHTDITDEWRTSMHADAQLSPVTVAQTELALQQDPNIEAICVNCHAPIGAQVTKEVLLPFEDQESHLGDVLSEGITCTVCHTLEEAPAEIRGGDADFPVLRRKATSFGPVFGPPLGEPPPIPVPAHDSRVGFMTDPLASSQLCGACHNVKVDLNDSGVSAIADSEGTGLDEDGNLTLDENELEIDPDAGADVDLSPVFLDLVLQTTFDEWEDYIAALGGNGPDCLSCHLPSERAPLVGSAPLGVSLPDRIRHIHTFAGVDYDLTPGHYDALGVGDDTLDEVLEDREELLRQAARLEVRADAAEGRIEAEVRIEAIGVGHDLPTGFAFARQMWLEVSAETASGEEVCLAVDPNGIPSPCASGALESPSEDLRPCDPQEVGLLIREVVLTKPAPLDSCDPWLTNYQKILTDGDPDRDGVFEEVPYQSLQPDIVKFGVRTADQQVMTPLEPIGDKTSASFVYAFDALGVPGEEVTVRAVLKFRHLPPYFLRGLDGFYPNGITSDQLLGNMTIVDMAEAVSDPVVA